MTILSVKNQLITHFLSNDVFEFSKHWTQIELDKEVVGFREDLIRSACQELEDLKIIQKLKAEDSMKEIWILVKPINTMVQSVTVGPLVSTLLADIINSYNKIEKISAETDKTNLQEGDLLRLVEIIGNLEQMCRDLAKEEGQKE